MSPPERRSRLSPLRIATLYAVFGILYILFSDQIVHAVIADPALESRVQTAKGWTFILTTAILVYLLVRRLTGRLERNAARAAESEALFRLAFETSPDVLSLVRLADGVHIAVNDGYEAVTGWPRDRIVGHTSIDLNIWADPADRARVFERLRRGEAIVNEEVRYRHADGRSITCLLSIRALELRDGAHFVAVARDVTALKEAEAALRRAMDELEERVEERTRALRLEILEREAAERSLKEANENLESRVRDRTRDLEREIEERKRAETESRHARDEAERANRAKTVFLANMSHELRTPLNSIIGFSDVLAREMFGPLGRAQYVEYAHDINESGRHLLELINDILDISRIEVEAITLSETNIELPRLMRSCARMNQERITEAGLSLELDIPDDLPALRADERRVRQIVLNLLSNARKFTPAGGEVRASVHIDDDDRVVIAVSDTGIGIAPEDMATALSTFGQADDNLSRRYQGAGIGLPLSHKLAELHDATLSVTSAVGKGTTVTVRFPPERTIRFD